MEKERVEVKDQVNVVNFEAVKISIASPDAILEWSHGEVIKPETINYRTQKPERDGLFCEKIFGPIKDWECYCGKYKKIRYKGIICDKCGVEVTRSSVRRVRMGHVDLAVPVSHIWYSRGTSPVIAQVLNMNSADLERVVYFASFIVMKINEEIQKQSLQELDAEYQKYIKDLNTKDEETSEATKELKRQKVEEAYKNAKSELSTIAVGATISEREYNNLTIKYGQIVQVGIGAEAILELLKKVDLDKSIIEAKEKLSKDTGANRRRILKRIKVLNNLITSQIKPEWLILTKLPVIPPDLRPMVQLDGGRFAASDLNDLYRRVLNRNNRLKRLLTQNAPEVICRNEKRMLQEAVDALIDNSARKGKAAMSAGGKRKLRSLSDMIRGKQGRFRRNLLGKRVDYSGRSVIVVGPNLKLHQCGIPKVMALELFKPFVIGRLIKDGYVHNVKNATRLIERGEEFVWDILEDITKNHHVMLNRAPTLHRLGIQAFQPVLIEGKAIQIHPLVCTAFNADFDGDQMAVHVPLSKQAQIETREIMLSSKNLLKPASGDPIVTPEKDIVLGLYYLTYDVLDEGRRKTYASINQVISDLDVGIVKLHTKIKVRIKDHGILETTAGRILVHEIIPTGLGYNNEVFDKKKIKTIISLTYHKLGKEVTAKLVDDFKDLGFKYAGLSGVSFAASDIQIPAEKEQIIANSDKKLDVIEGQFLNGLLSKEERYAKTVETWLGASEEIEQAMVKNFDDTNDISYMLKSGARGNISQLNQIAGMKGLVADPTGNIIELPIRSNFKEGLSVFEYFESTHGSRKGRADTALRTSEAGYLTRRLVDVSQDTVVTEDDCGTADFRTITKDFYTQRNNNWDEHIFGRILAKEVAGIKAGTLIGNDEIDKINQANALNIQIRSILHCKTKRGICKMCYGVDPATGVLVEFGATVGVVAAQAIGEPGTQLTMRTFHTGGAAGEDITTGLPRVEELLEARVPKNPAVISEIEGTVSISKGKSQTTINVVGSGNREETYTLPAEYNWIVSDGDKIKTKQIIAENKDQKPIRSTISGEIKIDDEVGVVTGKGSLAREYLVSNIAQIKVKDGDKVLKGDDLTEGHYDLSTAIKLKGLEKTQSYIIEEVQLIYESQGQSINDKHVEIIVKQMCSKVKINYSDDELVYLQGQVVNVSEVADANEKRVLEGKKAHQYENIIMGMSRVALKTDSFLSAASFMETTSVLIDAAISSKVDNLLGLKENIIIGKLIPAGTGFHQNVEVPPLTNE